MHAKTSTFVSALGLISHFTTCNAFPLHQGRHVDLDPVMMERHVTLKARNTVTVSPAIVTPITVSHGTLDSGALASLADSITKSMAPEPLPNSTGDPTPASKAGKSKPTPSGAASKSSALKARDPAVTHAPIPVEEVVKRQGTSQVLPTSVAVTTTSSGPFLAADGGGPASGSACSTVTINGPIQTLTLEMGTGMFISLSATDLGGNTTDVKGTLEVKDTKTFTLEPNERIKTAGMVVNGPYQIAGVNFTTDGGQDFTAYSSVAQGIAGAVVSVPTGSGILARIRGVHCGANFQSLGLDFLDELESVAVTNIDYSGFTDNIMPAGDGQTLGVGSQIIDNLNGTTNQQITLQTSAAVTRTHSLTTTSGWTYGGSISIAAKAKIPFVQETTVTAEANWQLQDSTADQNMTATTITNSATVNLSCPKAKYCVGSSFFTQYKMDVDVSAQFTATTKSSQTFSWVQKGRYSGADSSALQLRVDEADKAT